MTARQAHRTWRALLWWKSWGETIFGISFGEAVCAKASAALSSEEISHVRKM
jgi:hypothetical protein